MYMLAIPALVPAAVAAASVVDERQQGTLEPVLTTPIRREEFVAGKALAPLVPAVAVSYAVSARSSDVRVAQQLSMLASLPSAVVSTLVAFDVIHATLGLALVFGAALLVPTDSAGGSCRRHSTANGSSRRLGEWRRERLTARPSLARRARCA